MSMAWVCMSACWPSLKMISDDMLAMSIMITTMAWRCHADNMTMVLMLLLLLLAPVTEFEEQHDGSVCVCSPFVCVCVSLCFRMLLLGPATEFEEQHRVCKNKVRPLRGIKTSAPIRFCTFLGERPVPANYDGSVCVCSPFVCVCLSASECCCSAPLQNS